LLVYDRYYSLIRLQELVYHFKFIKSIFKNEGIALYLESKHLRLSEKRVLTKYHFKDKNETSALINVK
jgi:hypothetical protein